MVVILFQLCECIINELHDCHPGIVRMKVLAQLYFWWPSLDEMIDLKVKDTSHSEQNLSLHPIPHIIEPNQSNQTTTSPLLNNTLSDNPTQCLK